MRYATFLLLGTISLIGCGTHAPKVTWCVINGNLEILHCIDAEDKEFDLTLKEADKFLAQPRRDAEILRNYVIDLEKQLAHCHK